MKIDGALLATDDLDDTDESHLCTFRDCIVQQFTNDVIFSCLGPQPHVVSLFARDNTQEHGTLLSSEAGTYLDYVEAHRAVPPKHSLDTVSQGPKGGLVHQSASEKEFDAMCEVWQKNHVERAGLLPT